MPISSPSAVDANDFQSMPAHSRVWIYQSNRMLTEPEVNAIKDAGDRFVSQWAAHGSQLTASFQVFHRLFLVFFLDEKQASATGCSIDSSVGFVRHVMDELQIDLLDKLNLAYRDAQGDIAVQRMTEFQDNLKAGTHTADTVVFNNLVGTKGEFVDKWEVPVKASWHRQLL